MVKIYQVGGSVRDELLGVKSKDIDYAVEAKSFEEMKEYLVAQGFKIFLEAEEYCTIRAKFPKSSGNKMVVDFALCRKDGHYSDGRRPDSVSVCDLMGDLARRDFTVNAMAKDEDGTLIDPFGGQEDLEKMLLRCVGRAEDRIREDSLRALRAIRFMIMKGFTMDPELEEVLQSDWLPDLVRKLSLERIRQELYRTLAHDTVRTLEVLNSYPRALRKSIFRDGLWLEPTNKKSKAHFQHE